MSLNKIFNTLKEIIDEGTEYQHISENSLIEFDIQPIKIFKVYEKFVCYSLDVEPLQCSPGRKGKFIVTNLRINWKLCTDHHTNINIGLDTIKSIIVKDLPSYGEYNLKHYLIIKTQATPGIYYTFKFMGYSRQSFQCFTKLQQIHKLILQTKSYRLFDDSNIYTKQIEQYILPNQQIKSSYHNLLVVNNKQKQRQSAVILTNIRLLILNNEYNTNILSIPWILITYIEQLQKQNAHKTKSLKITYDRYFKRINLTLTHKSTNKQMQKIEKQIKFYTQITLKNPILGFQIPNNKQQQKSENQSTKLTQLQLSQYEQSKVFMPNIKKQIINNSQKNKGKLSQTCYNQQIGLMMQKFPQKTNRKKLWNITK